MSSRRFLLTLTLLIFWVPLGFAQRSALDWVYAVDRNQVLDSAVYTSVMTVHLPSGQERSFTMRGHTVGDKYALVEYIEPPRDAGTRYLRRDDQLWIYFPRVDRTMLVQGHMLREGVQGSDMSYEDMTQSSAWAETYNAFVIAESDTSIQIRLEAKDMSVSYPYREITIDKLREIPIRVMNYDASQYPIKEMVVERYEHLGERWFPVSTMIKSHLTEDKWTRFEMLDIQFDVPYKDEDFSKAALENVGG